MVALGDELCPDDDVDPSLRDLVQLLAHALDRVSEIARQDEHARVWKERGDFFLEAFDAGAAADQVSVAAHSGIAPAAASRSRNGGTRGGAGTMVDQPGVAIRARETVAALRGRA